MAFQIGKVFSDQVLDSVERARDRAARGGGGRVTRTIQPDFTLQEALLRAQGADADRALRRDLSLAELEAQQEREARARELGLLAEQGRMDRSLLADRRARELAGEAAGFRERELGVREFDAENRARRMEARSEYERALAPVRQDTAQAQLLRAQTDAQAEKIRQEMDRVTSRRQALDMIARLRREAFQPDTADAQGNPRVSDEKRRAYAALMREAAALFSYGPEAGGRGMGQDLGQEAGKALRDIIGDPAMAWDEELDDLDDGTGYLDLGD